MFRKMTMTKEEITRPVQTTGKAETSSDSQIAVKGPFKSPQGRLRYFDAYEAALKLWPVPHESLFVPTRFGITHVIASGPGAAPPLVLLHGHGTSATMWYPTVGALTPSYRTYSIDVMCQPGKSVPARKIQKPAGYVEWLTDVFDGLKITKAPLIGLSYGGWLAALFAAAAPQRVERLMLLAPAATFVPLKLVFFLRGMGAAIIGRRPLVNNMLNWFYAQGHKPVESFANQFAVGFQEYRAWTPVYPTVLTDPQLSRLNMPVLLMEGEHEVILDPQAAVERAKRLVPDIAAEILPAAAHLITVEQPEVVNARLLRFLAEGHECASALQADSTRTRDVSTSLMPIAELPKERRPKAGANTLGPTHTLAVPQKAVTKVGVTKEA